MDRSTNPKYLIRIDSEKTKVIGWQVRLNRKGNYLSKLFSDNVYGSKELAKIEAIIFRDQELKARGEGLDTMNARVKVILSTLPSNNTSGILGVSRTIAKERNGGKFPLWQTSYINLEGKVKTRGFRVNKLGELNALISAVEARRDGIFELFAVDKKKDTSAGYSNVIDEYEKILDYLYSLSEDDSQTLIEFLSSKEIGPTSKKEMLERRIAQQMFRSRIMQYWGFKCAITGASAFVIASHIKPWAIANDSERVNIHNGLALSPNYDKAFDLGFISFDINGKIMVKDDFIAQAEMLNIDRNAVLPKYTPLHDAFMKYHRINIFDEKASNKSLKQDK